MGYRNTFGQFIDPAEMADDAAWLADGPPAHHWYHEVRHFDAFADHADYTGTNATLTTETDRDCWKYGTAAVRITPSGAAALPQLKQSADLSPVWNVRDSHVLVSFYVHEGTEGEADHWTNLINVVLYLYCPDWNNRLRLTLYSSEDWKRPGWHLMAVPINAGLQGEGSPDLSDVRLTLFTASQADLGGGAYGEAVVTVDYIGVLEPPPLAFATIVFDTARKLQYDAAAYCAARGLPSTIMTCEWCMENAMGLSGNDVDPMSEAQLKQLIKTGFVGAGNYPRNDGIPWKARSDAERLAALQENGRYLRTLGAGKWARFFSPPGGAGDGLYWSDEDERDLYGRYLDGTLVVAFPFGSPNRLHGLLPYGRYCSSSPNTYTWAEIVEFACESRAQIGLFSHMEDAAELAAFKGKVDALLAAQQAGRLLVVDPVDLYTGAVEIPQTAPGRTVTISQKIDHADITDNGDATGYYDFEQTIPADAKVLSVRRDIAEAFKDTVGANTKVNVMLGDGTDDDRWDKTVDPGDDLWNSTADAAWDFSSFQGTVVTSARKRPRATFTTDSDMTDLVSGAGAQGTMTVYVTYRRL